LRTILRAKSAIGAMIFFLRNLAQARKIGEFQSVEVNGLTYRSYDKTDGIKVAEIYSKLNGGAKFSGLRRIMYDLFGARLMLVATSSISAESRHVILAMNMYYFNARDIHENTVHEGFIGVIPEIEGRGVATNMRKLAKAHFLSYKLNGISTRISVNNKASFESALKLGFQTVEMYFDKQSNETRSYMVCEFRGDKS
jgi:hypothetical protein